MRILVCGGRDFGHIDRLQQHHEPDHPDVRKKEKEYQFIWDTLFNLSMAYRLDVQIISGMATGADTVAVDFTKGYHLKLIPYPADWEKFGKAAGHIRNAQMLKEGKPDLVVAFPGGAGTAGMVKIAKEAGVEVIELVYNE